MKAEPCPSISVSLQGGLPRPPTVPAGACPPPPGLLTLAFPFQVEKKINPSLPSRPLQFPHLYWDLGLRQVLCITRNSQMGFQSSDYSGSCHLHSFDEILNQSPVTE